MLDDISRKRSEQQTYYVAVIVSRSVITANTSPIAEAEEELYEEAFVLISAHSLEDATAKARAHTHGAWHEYSNAAGEIVTWIPELVEVGEALVDGFEDGAEVYARFFRNRAAYERLGFETGMRDDRETDGSDGSDESWP